jgi:UDP-N-acetylmuramate dehydrogenase
MTSVLSAADRAALTAAAAEGDDLRFDEPMARHTTLRIGGPADAWFAPATIAGLERMIRTAAERGVPVATVGAGSNLLVKDGGLRGVVLAIRGLRGLEREGETGIRVEAGVSTGRLLHAATTWALGGLEFLGGVPGSVGGGLIMNAGTYLGEFVSVTSEVTSLRLADGARVVRDNAACGFRYRASDLPASEVVVEGRLSLRPRPRPEIEADVRSLRDRRREREPSGVANSGSTFKNPPGKFAGQLIETAGLKGRQVGAAYVSPKHANWLVNTGGASAADLLALIAIVRAEVEAKHGVTLELEVKVLGEDP